MKKIYPITFSFLFFIILANGIKAQTTQDTIDNPYWIQMMNNRAVNFYQTQRAFNLYWQNRTIEKGSGWKVFKRWEWQAEQEIDAQGNFPDTDVEDAAKEMLIQYENQKYQVYQPGVGMGTATCLTKGNWKPVGPINLPTNNTGQNNGMGRINAIGLHPKDSNIIFVGAAAGGIWKTTDGGATWNVFSDSLATLGVSSIAIDPINSDTMYFGSGDRDAGDALGYGVYKSTDGGKTWAQSTTGMGNREVGRLIIDPSNRAVLLAACDNGIYRSTDYGVNWTLVYTGGFMKDIIFNAYNTQQAYATRNGLFYRSTNNGVTWTQITSGLPTTGVSRAVIDVNPKDASLVYLWMANGSVNQGYYLSRDSGVTFKTQSTTPNLHDYSTTGSGTGGQAWYNKDMVSDPTNPAIIYVAGVNIFKSTDTGKTWTISAYWVNQVHADNHEMQRCPLTNRIYTGNDGGLYYTANKGTSWINISSGIAAAQIYKMGASRTDKDKLIVGFQDNGTGNYNGSWYTTYGGDGMDCEVDQTDSRYSYGELYYGDVFRIFNVNQQGKIAGNGTNGITESGAWVTPITLKEGSGNTMYIGYKNIWRSDNIRNAAASVTWTKISNSLGGSNTVNFTELESSIADPDVFYASRSGSLYRSDNINAATPTYTTLTQPVAGTISAIETDPKIAGVVYVGIGTRVYRSLNKGSTWTQINVNLPSNVQCVLLDTSSTTKGIYVGTQRGGVWYTDTTMSAWRYFSSGLPATVNVTDLELYYENKPECKCHVLYGSTYNRGVWKSSIFNDGSQKPVALIEKYDSVVCSSGVVTFKDVSCNNPTEFKWKFTPNTVTFLNSTNDSSADATVSFNAKGNYTFKHIVENCNGLDTVEGSILVGDTVVNACATTTTNQWTILGIFNVKFKTINRTSAGTNPEGAYVDLACTNVVKVRKGETFNIDVTTGASNTEQVKVFIDYNNDGDFVDAGELVWQPAAALINHSGSITIPLTATTGSILRFRVRSDFSSIGTNPCSNLNYGQTEDYGLYIVSDSIVPKFIRSDSNICVSKTVTFTDSTYGGSGYPYLWNFGAGAIPASAATPGPHTVTYSTPGYKKVTLTVDGILLSKDSVVLVNNSPKMSLSLVGNDSNLCKGEGVSLSTSDANASGASYQWQLNGMDVSDSIFADYRIANAALLDSGVYRIIAKKGICSDTSMAQLIAVHDQPIASFTTSADSLCFKANQFTFTNLSSIGNGTALIDSWNFGDASVSMVKSPNKSYAMHGTYLAKLIVSTAFGCIDSAKKSILVNPSPTSSFTVNNKVQCLKGNEFSFLSGSTIPTGTVTHLWKFGDGNTDAGVSPKHSYTQAYDSIFTWLIITSTSGCVDSSSAKLQVNPDPTAAFTIVDSNQCLNFNHFEFNSSSTLSSGSLTHLWRFGDGNTGTGINPNHSYLTPNTYSVRQISTTNNGCEDSIERLLIVKENTANSFTITQQTQCFVGHGFNFTNTSTLGTGLFSSEWQFGDNTQSALKDPLVKSYATLKDSYLVRLINQTALGCKDSSTKWVYLNETPQTNFTINDSSQCITGNNFIFNNLSSLSKGTFMTAWRFGDGSTAATQNTNHQYLTAADSFKVVMIATSNKGCLDSSIKNVYVHNRPNSNFTINDSTQCFNSNNFVLNNGSTIPKGTLTYNWLFGDGSSASTVNSNHAYSAVNNFKILLIATSNQNCKDSIYKNVFVYPNAKPNFSFNKNPQCFNNHSFDFTNASSISSGSFSNNWNLGDGNTSTNANILAKKYAAFSDSFAIQLKTTTNFGCIDSIILQAKLNKNPIANFEINDTGQCLTGNSFVFTDKSTQINASATHSWTFGDGTSSPNKDANHVYATAVTNKVKQLVTSNLGCIDSLEMDVYINPNPVANFSINDSTQCFKGNNFAFTETGNISSGTYTRTWAFGDASSGVGSSLNHQYNTPTNTNVDLTLISDSGCLDTKTIAVQIYPNPQVGFTVNDSAQCLNGNNFKFTDTTKNLAPGYVRAWYADANQLSTTLPNVQNAYTKLGMHTAKLHIVSADGCEDSLTKGLLVEAHPSFDITGSDKLCLNQALDLTATSTDPTLVYTWKENKKNPFVGNPYKVNGDQVGIRNFVLNATNDVGCETDSTFNGRVIVYALPKPIIDTSVITLIEGVEVFFKDITPTAAVSRIWDFLPPGSGTDSIERMTLYDTATITASLTITDNNGCIGTTSIPYFVIIPNNIYIPTAFSPNGDGRNDEFKIPGFTKFKQYNMRIFNRWGELVFESKDPSKGWDGKYNNDLVMAGNYGYYIEIIDLNGKKIVRQGTVLIMP